MELLNRFTNAQVFTVGDVVVMDSGFSIGTQTKYLVCAIRNTESSITMIGIAPVSGSDKGRTFIFPHHLKLYRRASKISRKSEIIIRDFVEKFGN